MENNKTIFEIYDHAMGNLLDLYNKCSSIDERIIVLNNILNVEKDCARLIIEKFDTSVDLDEVKKIFLGKNSLIMKIQKAISESYKRNLKNEYDARSDQETKKGD